jgi:hypothetical protein
MGESKTPLYAYVDESGNTGKNVFDEAQPDYFTAALITRGDFDRIWGARVKAIAARLNVDSLHAGDLGLGRLEIIAGDLLDLLVKADVHFFLCRVEKKYLVATKMFDILFDSGENAAVAWHNYNFKPLKIMLAFKLAHLITDDIAKAFWQFLLKPREVDARAMLPDICDSLLERLEALPDARSREVIGEALAWIKAHPDTLHISNERAIAKHGHYPNLVGFSNLLRGLQHHAETFNKKVAAIVHDEQTEFENALKTWHGLFSNAAPDRLRWAGEEYSLQTVPGSQLTIKPDEESQGVQVADVVLWLYAQAQKGRDLPEGCAQLLLFAMGRGWHDDFSFRGVEQSLMEKWGGVFFGPMEAEKLEAGRKMVEESERRRLASMAQFERDGVLPFMRDAPPAIDDQT